MVLGWEWGVRCSKEREKVPECKSSMCMVGEWWEENNHLPVDSLKKKKKERKVVGVKGDEKKNHITMIKPVTKYPRQPIL